MRDKIACVGPDEIIHDPATGRHGEHSDHVSVESARGRAVDCMTCLVAKARMARR